MIVDLHTQHLFDLDFVSDAGIDDIAASLIDDRDDHTWRCVVTPNVDHLVRYRRHPIEAETARHATVVLPDGMPIVWASHWLHRPLGARLTGSDLFAALWKRIVDEAIPTVVIASNSIVAERMSAVHPGVRCIVPPQFAVDDTEVVSALLDDVERHIDESGARFVVVGVSMPKHHLIAHLLRGRWANRTDQRPMVLLLGASPDFALGLTRRAPDWMQRTGLEWLYRLALEPRRLFKRYLVDDVAFAPLVWREWRTQRSARRRATPSERS